MRRLILAAWWWLQETISDWHHWRIGRYLKPFPGSATQT